MPPDTDDQGGRRDPRDPRPGNSPESGLAEARRQLDAAVAAAGTGDRDTASRLFSTVPVQAFSHDAAAMHKAGTVMRLTGNAGAALPLLRRSVALGHAGLAVLHADQGETDAALLAYQRAIEACPDDPALYLAAAKLAHDAGRSWSAVLLLEALYEQLPQHEEGNRVRTALLHHHAAHPERPREPPVADDGLERAHFHHMRALTQIADYRGVLAHAQAVRAAPGSFLGYHAAVFSGHAKLALAADSAAASARAAALERSAAWLDAARLTDRLRAAIRAREPFSLIRLGDGEARFLALTDPWARQHVTADEVRCIVDVIWRNWFDEGLAAVPPGGLESLADMVTGAMANASVLGVSTARRYDRDLFHRGYLALLERAVSRAMAGRPQMAAADAFANIHLHRHSPFYASFLRGLDFIGVISPHPGLAARLARHHGIPAFDEILVPGETRLPAKAQGRALGRHFPDRFHQVMDGLRPPRPGAVYLAAAGLLGKIYCEHIRQGGGIGIDIGSIADAWMGFGTRPGLYTPPEAWILPDRPAPD